MTARKPPADIYLAAWKRLQPLAPNQRAENAREDRLAELRQAAEFDALEPMNEFLDAFTQHNLDN